MFKAGKFTQRIQGTLREFTADDLAFNQGVSVPRTNNNNGPTAYSDDVTENYSRNVNTDASNLTDNLTLNLPKSTTNAVDDDGAGPF